MDTLVKKLALAVFVGLVIVGFAYVVAEVAERHRLIIEATKDLGIIIIGIAAVEVVWAWAGGSPTELDLRRLIRLNEALNKEMKADVASLSKSSNDIKVTSTRIEDSVQHMTTIVTAAHRTGLANVGASQDELGYPPSKFATEVKSARDGIDLCGCTLHFVYSNDSVFDALTEAVDRGVPVRILLPAPDSSLLVAMFNDRFEESIRQGSRSLIKRIMESKSKIQLKVLANKALTLCMLRIDEAMLTMPYMYFPQTSESPRFDIRGSGSPLFRVYQAEFNAMFNAARPARQDDTSDRGLTVSGT